MHHETLDYRTLAPGTPKRPRRLISHAITGAALCLVAVWFDRRLRFDRDEARHLPWIELALVLYGFTSAAISLGHGRLRRGDFVAWEICLVVFVFTAYVALLMPRVIHN